MDQMILNLRLAFPNGSKITLIEQERHPGTQFKMRKQNHVMKG